ncbi:MAG: thioredoxin domain-containing protein [Lachnospiraceae bacterium]|nr:thioredoxin domain-containing protein [Lachnospiraceae bacterium]
MTKVSVKLGQNNFESSVLKEEKLVLVDFYSDSCVPCKRLSPILADLEEDYEDKLVVGKVNAIFEQDLVQQYDISSTPTVLLFKNGEIKARFGGKIDKNELVDQIKNNL